MQVFSVAIFLFVVAIGVQSTPLALFKRYSSSECQGLILGCFSPAVERYSGKDETEIFEEIRDTPLRTHCSDWNTAMGCFRQVIYSDTCDELRPGLKNLNDVFELYSWVSNYACVEHFDKVDRNFRCLVSLELIVSVVTTCSDSIENMQDPCELVKQKSELLQCSSEAVTGKCGAEAASVARDFGVKGYDLLEKQAEEMCPTSNRARQLAVLKEVLSRL